MKQMILCAGILLLAGAAEAQNKKATSKKAPAKKAVVQQAAIKPAANTTGTVTLTNTSTNEAYGAPLGTNRFSISDPTVRTLNARANGADIRVSGSGVIGMPRGSYGFANGRITLIPRGSRTSGTQTGSGAVGTGTSPASAGASGHAVFLNGKNPYAGTEIWPSTYNTNSALGLTDSTRRNR